MTADGNKLFDYLRLTAENYRAIEVQYNTLKALAGIKTNNPINTRLDELYHSLCAEKLHYDKIKECCILQPGEKEELDDIMKYTGSRFIVEIIDWYKDCL